VHHLHPSGASQLLVVPGGTATRLLALPEVSTVEEAEPARAGDDRTGGMDGAVADLHALSAPTQDLLAEYGAEGVPVYHADPLYRLLTARIPLGVLSEASLDPHTSRGYRCAKRTMDLFLIAVSLPVTLPLIAATALAIRIGSRGPVLFWQERVGRHGEPFQMAKFRSMYVGHEGEDRAVFAAEDDDRVTPVGQVIRQFRIDELPQIWNVLKGEMSLIGPRPEQVGLAENFRDALQLYHARHLVRPGITGWAQVLQGYAADVDETRRKLEHDLYYVEHRSVLLDLLIIYLTLKTLFTGGGAR
jgi:lipopolysaccharide/colanic/teichoic acid biosynthesis glycosyltransferase